jgi:hypothetical protein
MDPITHSRTALAALLAAVTITAGCGSPVDTAAPYASPIPAPSAATVTGSQSTPTPAVLPNSHGGRGGSGSGSSVPPVGLPADWPADLPVPSGEIMGSTGSAGRWSVLILASGSAAEVRSSTVAFYAATGFTAVTDSVLNKGNRQITVVVENRDHSNTQTNLMVGVTTR